MSQPAATKVCVVSLYSYPLFNPQLSSPFGGSEVRISLIAKELAKRNQFNVSLIVFDHGQPHVETRHGVTIYSWTGKTCPLRIKPPEKRIDEPTLTIWEQIKPYFPSFVWEVGRKGYRLYQLARKKLSPCRRKFQNGMGRIKLAQRRKAAFGMIASHIIDNANIALYDEVDADIYITHGNNAASAELAFYCNERKKKFIMVSGSDMDFDPAVLVDPLKVNNYGVPGFLMRYTIQQAHTCIVQNESQAHALEKKFSRQAIIVRNPMDMSIIYPPSREPEIVLWVGKSDAVKRPDLAVDLAARLPNYPFEVIMNYSNQEIHDRCLGRAAQMPNVKIYNYVPYSEVEEYFSRAAILINTSIFEGFPNAFLQAAKYGIPIVSLELDPGGMLLEHNSGFVCGGSLDTMQEMIRMLLTQPALYKEKSAACKRYVHQFHSKEIVMDQFAGVFASLMRE